MSLTAKSLATWEHRFLSNGKFGWPVDLLAGTQQGALTAQSFAPDVPAVAPTISSNGVQLVAMTLRAGRYEPRLVDIKAGAPVRLSMQAIGDPG